MLSSLLYQLTRALLGALIVRCRRKVSDDAELLVLRHENAVLRRQIIRMRYTAGRKWDYRDPASTCARQNTPRDPASRQLPPWVEGAEGAEPVLVVGASDG